MYRSYSSNYPHRSRDSVPLVCRIFCWYNGNVSEHLHHIKIECEIVNIVFHTKANIGGSTCTHSDLNKNLVLRINKEEWRWGFHARQLLLPTLPPCWKKIRNQLTPTPPSVADIICERPLIPNFICFIHTNICCSRFTTKMAHGYTNFEPGNIMLSF